MHAAAAIHISLGMTGDDIGQILYLTLLLVFVGGWLLRARARQAGQILRQAGSWVLIFIAVMLAAGLWSDIRRDVPRHAVITGDGRIEVPRAADGHYYLTAEVGGAPVRFLVDTGATDIVLSREDARRIGADDGSLIFSGRAGTANGAVRTAPVRLPDVSVGPVSDSYVLAHVNEGEMTTSLLGMSYLRLFDRIEIADDRLILER